MKNYFLSQKKILQHFDKQDSVMAGIIRGIGPFRLQHNRKYFQVLCKAIIAQQISTSTARAVTKRFLCLFDRCYPTANRVIALTDCALRGVGLSRQKVSYLKDLSNSFMRKTIRPHRLKYLPNEEVIRQLTEVKGIGQWTAEMFLIFSLNRLDVLPLGDLGFQIALKNIYQLKEVPSAKTIRQLAKPWHPYETVATWYAWRSLDTEVTVY